MAIKKLHTQAFLNEMQTALQREEQQLLAVLKQHAHKEHGTYEANFPEYERDPEANAMESADAGVASAATEAEETRLKAVSAALKRLADGTYGVTTSGEVIPEARLRANPAATTVITAGT